MHACELCHQIISMLIKSFKWNLYIDFHNMYIYSFQQLGVPMKVHTRFQVNLLMGDIKFNNDLRPYKDTTLPILWLEMVSFSLNFSIEISLGSYSIKSLRNE